MQDNRAQKQKNSEFVHDYLAQTQNYYAVDMGLRTINTNTINYEDTFFLENVIYNELVVRGYHIFTG